MTDPRYDPRFQRGWNGELPPPVAVPVTRDPGEPGLVATPQHEQSTAAAPVDREVVWTDAVGPESADAQSADTRRIEFEHADSDDAPHRNVPRIALAVLGVLLLAATGGLIQQAMSMDGSSEPAKIAFSQFAQSLIPVLGFAGFLAVVVAIALGAMRRR